MGIKSFTGELLIVRASPIKNTMNGGELSPLMAGRIDIDKYASGCQVLQNFIPLPQGPATRRPGTKFVAEARNHNERSWLLRFEFNFRQSFILEFSPGFIRFFSARGQVLKDGKPYEIASPYTKDDLTNLDGTIALSLVQSNDVIYIACRNKPVQKLSRLSNTNWKIEAAKFTGGPYEDANTDEGLNVKISGGTGDVAIKCSQDNMFGSTFSPTKNMLFLEQSSIDTIKPWESQKDGVKEGDLKRNDSKNYKAVSAGKTGYVSPVHTKGQRNDGDPGVAWAFRDDGTGVIKITGRTNAKEYTGNVQLNQLPVGCVEQSTFAWARNAWNAEDGYPTDVTFFRERLVFARDTKLWFSCASDYENFNTREFGEVLADSAIIIDAQSDNAAVITYLVPTAQGLLVGTSSGEMMITNASTSEPFGPTNIKVSPTSGFGSTESHPVRVETSVLFMQRSGMKLRESTYNFQIDNFTATDLTIFSEHITKPGVIGMAYQREPYNILWLVRADGVLLGFTYNPEQEVKAWHRHVIGGGGIVECVQTMPSPDGSIDDLWLIVKYTINGTVKRYVQYMTEVFATGMDQKFAFYVDCGATYDSTGIIKNSLPGDMQAKIISGLNWLEGCTVDILADGKAHTQRVVKNGTIELEYPVKVAQIGLPYKPILKTMRIEGGSGDGTSQGKIKRINSIVFRVINTLGLKVGPDVDGPWESSILNERSPFTKMDQATGLFSGDTKRIVWNGGYETAGCITITQDQPYPMTICAIFPQVVTSDLQ